MNTFGFCFVALFLGASAEKLNCPVKAIGQYPSCKCLNGGVYDVTYNWCVYHNEIDLYFGIKIDFNLKLKQKFFRCTSDLEQLSGKCPHDGPGIYPNCNCGIGKSFDSLKKVCAAIDHKDCPKGATGS